MDGVLNSADYKQERYPDEPIEWGDIRWWTSMVNPEGIKLLNEILDATGAKVVISSSWRNIVGYERMQEILDARGFTGEVIGQTPTVPELPKSFQGTGKRGTEIEVWLAKNTHLNVCDYFVILDDMGPTQFDSLTGHLVQTSWASGLRPEHVKRAVEILQDE